MSMTRRLATLLCTLVCALAVNGASAAGADPALMQVQTLTRALLASMRAGAGESMTARYRKLEPVIERVFAIPLMTRLAAGDAAWVRFPPKQQHAVIRAFLRYTTANYAHDFRRFDGQRFSVDRSVVNRSQEKIVRAGLASRNGTPTMLLYRMVEVHGVWKVVDVYYNGISQLTLHRVDFAGAIASGGAPALIAYLNKVSDDLMR